MNRKFLIICILLSSLFSSYAQECWTDQLHEFNLQNNAAYNAQWQAFENSIQQNNNINTEQNTVAQYSIPIVFQIAHKGEPIGVGSNISDEVVYQALDLLNKDFANSNGEGVNIDFEFCLASVDPDGNFTTGINRNDGSEIPDFSLYGYRAGPGSNEAAIKDLSRWPEKKYINIYIVPAITHPDISICGLATLPTGFSYDGIIIAKGCLLSNKTLTHEMGHAFGLRHTFYGEFNSNCNGTEACCPINDNCMTDGDRICDTPPHTRTECGEIICGASTDIENVTKNYMSYCGDKKLFTQGQKDWMHMILQGPARSSLLNSIACNAPSDNVALLRVEGNICGDQLIPRIKIRNRGATTLTTLTVEYQLDNQALQTENISLNLDPNQNEILELPSVPISASQSNLFVSLLLPNGNADPVLVDNAMTKIINHQSITLSPIYLEDFENEPNDLPLGWSSNAELEEFPIISFWKIEMPSGESAHVGTQAFLPLTSTGLRKDILKMPNFDFSDKENVVLSFDMEFDNYSQENISTTTLKLFATNCALGTTELVYEISGYGFFPLSGTTIDVDLSAFDGEVIQLSWEYSYDTGLTFIRLDNINIQEDEANNSLTLSCPLNAEFTTDSITGLATIVFDDATGSTTCPNVGLNISNTSAYASGDQLEAGTYEVTFEAIDNCGNAKDCSFTITVVNDNSSDCPPSLAGFTTLGEFENSKYYLSDEITQWQNAESIANATDGYLVSINSQAENDFLQQNISEIVFIGFNDAQTEESFSWSNGDMVSFNNFTDINSEENDFGKMNFWNGGWGLDNQFVARKYIIEIPCGNLGGGSITLNCPADLQFTTDPNTDLATVIFGDATGTTTCPNKGLNIVNTGLIGSGDELGVGFYTIPFEAMDACGNVETCFFNITVTKGNQGSCPGDILGFTTLGEFGTSKYYLSDNAIQADQAQNIAEQNGGYLAAINSQMENDFIQQNITEMVYIGLNDVQTEGDLVWENGEPFIFNNINPCSFCSENSPDLDYVIIAPWDGEWSFSSVWSVRKYILEIPCQSTGTVDLSYDCPIEFPQEGIWNIPVTISNNFGATTIPQTLSLFLEKSTSAPNPPANFGSLQIPALANGEVINVNLEVTMPTILAYSSNTDLFPNNVLGFINYGDYYLSLSPTIEVKTTPFDFYCKKYITDLDIEIQNVTPTYGTDSLVRYSVAITNKGSVPAYNIQAKLLKTLAISPNPFIPYSVDINNRSHGSWERLSNKDIAWFIPYLEDGETATIDIVYHLNTPFEYGTDIPNSLTIDVNVTSGHLQDSNLANNSDAYTFTKEDENPCPSDISGFTYLGNLLGNDYFLSNDLARPIDAESAAVQLGGHLVSINGQAENDFLQQNISEMVYIGLHDASIEETIEWTSGEPVNFTNFDFCSFCNENTADFDYGIIHPWNGGWSFSSKWNQRKFIVEIPCNIPNGSSASPNVLITKLDTIDKKLSLEKIHPNPTMYDIFTTINAPSEQEVEVQIYDARGEIVKIETLNLTKGRAVYRIAIAKLPSGFYSVFIPQAHSKNSTLRFVKLRD